jgi:hypothetical protein
MEALFTSPPVLPISFTSNIVRQVTGEGPLKLSNLSLACNGEKKEYHIQDYSDGTYYESWFVQTSAGAVIYTFSPDNIPGPTNCNCLPTNNISYLPEFLSLKGATNTGPYTIRNQSTTSWAVHNELITNDTYTAYVADDGVPLRIQWIDPLTASDNIVETSDYTHFIKDTPPSSEFVPSEQCLEVHCT